MGKVKIEVEVDSEDVLGDMESRDILEHVSTEESIRHGTKEAPWMPTPFLDELESVVHQFTDKAFNKLESLILEESKKRGEK
jgi:hypothetical protein